MSAPAFTASTHAFPMPYCDVTAPMRIESVKMSPSKPLDRPSPSRSMPVSTALERVAGRPSGSIRG